MSKIWGWSTHIDSSGCNQTAINSPKVFQEFVDELLKKIDMVKIGDLHIIWCETNEPEKVGYSIFQLLQTSNISAHFCPADQDAAYLDCFSCKEYDENIVIEVFKKYFSPAALNFTTLQRCSVPII